MVVREYFASDTRFYVAFGVFMMMVFFGGIATAAVLDLAAIDRRLIPLAGGFVLFMFVYFISITADHLIPNDS